LEGDPMTRAEIVAVAIRLLALWLLFAAVSFVAVMAVQAVGDENARGAAAAVALVMTAMLLILSMLTWKFSVTLANRVLPQPDPGVKVTKLGSQELERLALRVLGLNLTAWGLSGIAYSIAFGFAVGREEWIREGVRAQGVAELARHAALLILGLALFLGKAGLKRIFDKVRDGGMDEVEKSEE
jgi:hypothetical protein